MDVLDIGNPGKGTKGDPISIFVFSDGLEVKSISSLVQYTHHLLNHKTLYCILKPHKPGAGGEDGNIMPASPSL